MTGKTAHWNLLDYPGVVFPVTKVDSQLDPVETDYVPKNGQDAFVHDMYSPEIFAGAPQLANCRSKARGRESHFGIDRDRTCHGQTVIDQCKIAHITSFVQDKLPWMSMFWSFFNVRTPTPRAYHEV